MRIDEILKTSRPVFSFEFFPPKDDDGFPKLFQTIEKLKDQNPGYISVTYGAGGSTRAKTIDLVQRIKKGIGLESMAHLTCVGHDSEEIDSILDTLLAGSIDNVLALRGDPPKGETKFVKSANGFAYGYQLVEFIRKKYSFCVGVAGYPEGHVECPDIKQDIEHLKQKVDSGADFIITQLFFDNNFFFDFMDRVEAAGIRVPVIPGIMPILNFNQIQRFTKMCGASIPKPLAAQLEKVQEDAEAVKEIGVRHATEQCRQLLREGAAGIHFYTLNRSMATLAILKNLRQE